MTVEAPSLPVTEGGVFFVSVVSDRALKEVSGQFQNEKVVFFPDSAPAQSKGLLVEKNKDPLTKVAAQDLAKTPEKPEPFRYTAIVGVEYGTTAGKVTLRIAGRTADGDDEIGERKIDVVVKNGVFRSEILRVPPRMVSPNEKDLKQIEKDRELILKAYANSTNEKLWDPPVLLPVRKGITSPYGSSRVYNGIKHNVHYGTDFRAPLKTPIHAPITGRAVVARFLFYTGYTVILDHGYGLFTIYGHMSKLKVKEGNMVKKGQVVGLSGATGRSSGPHLHWGVNLHGVKVDPMVFAEMLK